MQKVEVELSDEDMDALLEMADESNTTIWTALKDIVDDAIDGWREEKRIERGMAVEGEGE